MLYRTVFLYAAMGLAAGVTPALSSTRTRHAVEIAPIGAQVRIVPAASAGYAWAPAYQNGLGHEHTWVGSDYLRERLDDHWVADHRDQPGAHWYRERGWWDHD